MYCRVLACDFDGTGATDGRLAPEAAAALSKARAHGLVSILVTGRVFEEVQALCHDLSMFDAVVAENGAVVFLPAHGRTVYLGEPPAERFLGELRARGVPFQAGAVIIGTWDRHTGEVLSLIRRFGTDSQLIFNRGAMMVLPSGVNKAVGTRRALEELGRSEHNMIAFGDAENDLPLFALAEVAVAAREALPSVAARADERLSQTNGQGVAQYVHRLLEQKSYAPTPSRHGVTLGVDPDGVPVTLPCSGVNVMVSGDPRSGKSWLAGLVAEQLIDKGYRLCIFDPEGDYLSLARRPGVLLLGNEIPLPAAATLPRLLRDNPASVVVNLTAMPQHGQLAYIERALPALADCAAATGIPHWIVIDEAQSFFHSGGGSAFSGPMNFLFATYRPLMVSEEVYAAMGAHVITGTAVEEERYFVTSLLQARGPRELAISEALAGLQAPLAGLLLEYPVPRWQVFLPGMRLTAHAHHGRKYADTRLGDDRAFRFLCLDEAQEFVARNVLEFHAAVQAVPMASLRHHLVNGDFSRWVAGVLGDERLARGLRKLERATRAGAPPSRQEILAHIEDHYLIELHSR